MMEFAFVKYHATIEILPHLMVSKLYHKGKTAWYIEIGWLVWGLDIQYTHEEKRST